MRPVGLIVAVVILLAAAGGLYGALNLPPTTEGTTLSPGKPLQFSAVVLTTSTLTVSWSGGDPNTVVSLLSSYASLTFGNACAVGTVEAVGSGSSGSLSGAIAGGDLYYVVTCDRGGAGGQVLNATLALAGYSQVEVGAALGFLVLGGGLLIWALRSEPEPILDLPEWGSPTYPPGSSSPLPSPIPKATGGASAAPPSGDSSGGSPRPPRT